MENYLNLKTLSIDKKDVKISIPKTCPDCGIVISPEIVHRTNPRNAFDDSNSGDNYFAILYQCPECGEFFVKKYTIECKFVNRDYHYIAVQNKSHTFPKVPYPFENDFSDVSPKFKEIYNQSQLAESIGLDEICGMGYRKALEHLLRDYYDVKEGLLGQVISKIDNPQIQALAKISSWLGNDHAHYDVKHPQKTIDDIKRFIQAIVHHISMEIVTKEAIDYIENQ